MKRKQHTGTSKPGKQALPKNITDMLDGIPLTMLECYLDRRKAKPLLAEMEGAV